MVTALSLFVSINCDFAEVSESLYIGFPQNVSTNPSSEFIYFKALVIMNRQFPEVSGEVERCTDSVL